MPIYEYFCPSNRRIYSFFARSLRYADKVPRCPDNPKWKLEKMVSGFAVTGRAKEAVPTAPGGDGPDEARMDAAMGQLEKEFGHIAESENPDPRALAKMMRRMGELSGQKLPADMDEVIVRLEKGEDPDQIEAEYGGTLEAMGGPDDDAPADGGDETKRTTARNRKRVTRDPQLYDMGDYCD